MFKKLGPGVLVAAAFIGPGTVTACTLAGVGYGFSLLWAMLWSILATMVLQEMSARVGIVTQRGLAQVIREELKGSWVRNIVIGIILSAIVIGNTAYEAGNIGGATLGMQALFGNNWNIIYPFVLGVLCFSLLYFGNYKILEKVFVLLVGLMSLSFIFTALLTQPNYTNILKGLLVPHVDNTNILAIISIVGTTIVPYNLFLHASLVNEKWKRPSDLKWAKRDTFISIALGGLVSISIIVAAAATNESNVKTIMDLARTLEPLYGKSAQFFMGIGLFAAGTTSAITAPLAAAYVANNCFGWDANFKDVRFRTVWMLVLAFGVVALFLDFRPIEIINFAQIANGLLLPFIAIFLLWIVNRTDVMGRYKNTFAQNILGGAIILFSIFLGLKSILKVTEVL